MGGYQVLANGGLEYYSQMVKYMEYQKIRHIYWNLIQILMKLIYLETWVLVVNGKVEYYSQMARYMEYHRIRDKY